MSGTRFLANGKPFPYTGVSFLIAIYNPAFNASSEQRLQWLAKFRKYGVNVLRVWCRPPSRRASRDTEGHSRGREYGRHGRRAGLLLAGKLSREHPSGRRGISTGRESADRGAPPYRNLTFQIWNERTDDQVLALVASIKSIDSRRLVTNSPAFSAILPGTPRWTTSRPTPAVKSRGAIGRSRPRRSPICSSVTGSPWWTMSRRATAPRSSEAREP